MSKQTYVFLKQVHFGGLKFSVAKGAKFDLVESKTNRYAMLDGEKITELKEFDICIKNGFAIPFVEGETEVDSTIRIMPHKDDNNLKKMRVEKSDADEMPESIDISHTKNANVKKKKEEIAKAKRSNVAEENYIKTVRGMKVLKSNAKTIGGAEEIGSDDIASMVNGDDAKVVASIKNAKKELGDTNATQESAPATPAKPKEMSESVKARLEARKKQAKQGHEKTVAGKK